MKRRLRLPVSFRIAVVAGACSVILTRVAEAQLRGPLVGIDSLWIMVDSSQLAGVIDKDAVLTNMELALLRAGIPVVSIRDTMFLARFGMFLGSGNGIVFPNFRVAKEADRTAIAINLTVSATAVTLPSLAEAMIKPPGTMDELMRFTSPVWVYSSTPTLVSGGNETIRAKMMAALEAAVNELASRYVQANPSRDPDL